MLRVAAEEDHGRSVGGSTPSPTPCHVHMSEALVRDLAKREPVVNTLHSLFVGHGDTRSTVRVLLFQPQTLLEGLVSVSSASWSRSVTIATVDLLVHESDRAPFLASQLRISCPRTRPAVQGGPGSLSLRNLT